MGLVVVVLRRFKPKTLPDAKDSGPLSFFECNPSEIDKTAFEKIKSILGQEWHGVRLGNGKWELLYYVDQSLTKVSIFIQGSRIEVVNSESKEPLFTLEGVGKITITKDSSGKTITATNDYGRKHKLLLGELLIKTDKIKDDGTSGITEIPMLSPKSN